MSQKITVETFISSAPIEKIWEYFTKPEHITHWNFASDDWCSPRAENDLKVGGKFNYRMEAKDGSFGFDFGGTYTTVEKFKKIYYTMGDGRKAEVDFVNEGNGYQIIETFEAENMNPIEMQKSGWQAILNNFKKQVEA